MTSLCVHCGKPQHEHSQYDDNSELLYACPIRSKDSIQHHWHPTNRFTPRSEEQVMSENKPRAEEAARKLMEEIVDHVLERQMRSHSVPVNEHWLAHKLKDALLQFGQCAESEKASAIEVKSPATVQPEPQSQWRLLEPNEKVQVGDELRLEPPMPDTWSTVKPGGHSIGYPAGDWPDMQFRRRVEPAKQPANTGYCPHGYAVAANCDKCVADAKQPANTAGEKWPPCKHCGCERESHDQRIGNARRLACPIWLGGKFHHWSHGSSYEPQVQQPACPRCAELEVAKAAFAPIADWYHSDEQQPRQFAEMLKDAVADFQQDRQEALGADRLKRELDQAKAGFEVMRDSLNKLASLKGATELLKERDDLKAKVGQLEKERDELQFALIDKYPDARALEQWHKIRRENDDLKAKCEAMSKALKPFAEMATQYGAEVGDDAIVNRGSLPITLGLLRQASAALAGGKE